MIPTPIPVPPTSAAPAPDFATEIGKCSGVDLNCKVTAPFALHDPANATAAGGAKFGAQKVDGNGKPLLLANGHPDLAIVSTPLDGWIYDHALGAYFCPVCAPQRLKYIGLPVAASNG